MKQLDNLDEKIPYPKEFEGPEDISAKTEDERAAILQKLRDDTPTFRRMLRLVCMNVQPQNLAEADACDQVRLKLMQGDSVVLIEDNEFELLFGRVKNNPLKWQNYTFMRVINFLREAEKKKVEMVPKKD